MKKMVIDRILRLEKKFATVKFDAKKHTEEIVNDLELFLEYKISDRIDMTSIYYIDIDNLDRYILSHLTVKELKKLAYCS